MVKWSKIILVVLALLTAASGPSYGQFVAQHWVIGTIEAGPKLSAEIQGKEIRAYLVEDPESYLTDLIGTSGNSGVENQFQINLFENQNWKPGAKAGIFIPPFEAEDKTYAALTEIETTDKGYDFLSTPLALVEADSIAPKIALSLGEIEVSAYAEGAAPDPVTLSLYNEGLQTLSFTATTDASWLSILPPDGAVLGTSSTDLTLSFDISNLKPGLYEATLWISDPKASNQVETAKVTLEIKPAFAGLELSEDEISLIAPQGAVPGQDILTLKNEGDAEITFVASSDAEWLTLSATEGSLAAGESMEITISYDISGLAPGDYEGIIYLSNPDDPSQVKTLKVKLTVTAAELSPETTKITVMTTKGAKTADQTIAITNTTDQALTYQATSDAKWLTINNPTGTILPGQSSDLSLSFNTEGLPPGDYEATIWITDANDPSKSTAITVKITVKPEALALDKSSINSSIEEGQDAASATFKVTNNTEEPFNFLVKTDQEWLTVSPAKGAINAGEELSFSITFDTDKLSAGTHEATVTLYDPNDPSKIITIPVKIFIQPKKTGEIPVISDIYFGSQLYSPKIIAAGKPFIVSSTPLIKATVKGADGINPNSLSLAMDKGTAAEKILMVSASTFTQVVAAADKTTQINYAYQIEKETALTEGKHEIVFSASNEFGEGSASAEVVVMAGSAKVLDTPLTYPSPFSPLKQGHTQVIIAYTLNVDTNIEIYLFNLSGEIVKRISCAAGTTGGAAGYNKVTWNGVTDFGEIVANGIYLGTIVSKDDNKVIAKFKLTVFD